MKNQIQPLLAAVLLSGALSLGLSSQSFGDEHTGETDEAPVEEFYLHGFIEVGGLVFIDRPAVGERTKFEEYGETSPGFIVPEVYIEFGSMDGLNLLEFRGTDLTWNNRNAVVEFSRAGQLYVTGEWDETPHLLREQAVTPFEGVGTDSLTAPDALQTDLTGLDCDSLADEDTCGTIIGGYLQPVKLEVDRDTASVGLRYTPTPQWDFQLNYSNEDRDGARSMASYVSSSGAGLMNFPEPIDYTTQNIGASAQYNMDLGNGRHWVTNLAYAGSFFDNANESVSVESPFTLGAPAFSGSTGDFQFRNGLYPDNHAHRITLQTAGDLAEKTRFTGSVSYNMMRQDETFLPWTINSDAAGTLATDPAMAANGATSLNGEINTLTIDSKLTTRDLHPDVTLTAKYRYYLNDNDTPELVFPQRISRDRAAFSADPRVSLQPGYVKQNANLDTVWRAHDMATLGLLLGWEQMDRDIGREADVSDEFSVKATADLTPNDWLSVRASALYAERRANIYDYVNRVGQPGHDYTDDGDQDPLIRKYDMSDRDRLKLNVSAEVVPSDGLTITALGGFRDDDHGDNFGPGEIGLDYDRSWDAGIELDYMLNERFSFFASYTREEFDRRIRNNNFVGSIADIDEAVDTFLAGVDVVLVPDAVDLKLSYTLARGVEEWIDQGTPYPDVTNNFQRFDASLNYTFNEDQKRRFGWTGDAVATLAYAYERNRDDNWANDVTFWMPDVRDRTIWLAGLNPNYDAQIVAATLKFKW